MREIEQYEPFSRQAQFHSSPAKYRLFGGAAGPGKSRALLEEADYWAGAINGCDCLLLRRTFAELEKSILTPFRRHVLPRYDGKVKYDESKYIAHYPNGSNIYFGYCRNERDVYQYQGGEFFFIGIDELTMFTLKMWQFLTSRNRCPVKVDRKGNEVVPCMAGATNPGNIGHAWVRALWGCTGAKIPAPGMEDAWRYDPNDYEFIRARLDDNPIYASDASYRKTLESLPPQLRRAFLEGDWNIFAGQYFDIFQLAKHTHEHGAIDLMPWWPKWGSIDWGFAHPSCVHLHAKDGDRAITFDELWGAGIGEFELGRNIVDAARGYRLDNLFLSPDAFAKRGSANTVADQINEGIDSRLEELKAEAARSGQKDATAVPHCEMADNDRIGGARLMYQLLRSDLWTIDSLTCPKLIECLPILIHDEDNIEDVLKVDHSEGTLGDDPYDSARYGLKSMLEPKNPPVGVQVDNQIEAWVKDGRLSTSNPTAIMMWRKTLELRAQNLSNRVRFAYRGLHGSARH